MSRDHHRKPVTIETAALAVVRRLRDHGHEGLWAGGCVRDMLLGHRPADIDVATNAPPEVIIQLFPRTRKVGAQFGVVLIRQNSYWIETATYRTDLDYQDGRRPERVVFTTAQEDSQRRDFTINGLFYDPIDQRVIDYVGGQRDLEARLVRAIGNPAERFAEDHLRMLRAVRFAARLGFTIDPATAKAIRCHAEKVGRISPERIREELAKMLGRPSRARAVELMAELGLLGYLPLGGDWPADRVNRAVKLLGALPDEADFTLSLAALLHAWTPTEAAQVGRALRCSNDEIDHTAWLIRNVRSLDQTESMSLASMKRLMAHTRFDDLLALHKAVCRSEGRSLEAHEAALRRRDAIPPEQVTPLPFVSGEDLMALGLEPGPQFKTILAALYDAQLNNELTTRESALQRLSELAK